jgi:hypothetical protein
MSAAGGRSGEAPIFVGGCGRSGTTLLRVILDTHPNIACGPELKLIPGIARDWATSVRHLSDLLSAYGLSPTDVNRCYREFIESFLAKLPGLAGKTRVAEKTPNNVFFFRHLNQLFPESPLIHVIRDGRDVVCSLLSVDWIDPVENRKLPITESAEAAASFWRDAVTAGREAARSESVSARYYELRYEDVVSSPEATLRPLFEFLREPWSPGVLEFHAARRDLAGESSADQVSRGLYTHSVGRWQRDLSDRDRETVKRIAGDLLVELGYEEDLDW